jgi:SAM-dependent methyltransferase
MMVESRRWQWAGAHMNNRQNIRRESFDEVADLYDVARPGYPRALVDDLVELTGLCSGTRVLEIGCGTGQLTLPLAERGASLMAVELGKDLARITLRKLARFDQCSVSVADFDLWPLPTESFDIVVAATAFHWLNPTTRVHKCADAIRPGGWMAIVDTHWGVGPHPDRFSIESQVCYGQWNPDNDPNCRSPIIGDLPDKREDLASSQRFATIFLKRYACPRQYSATGYRNLLSTFSDVLALEEHARIGLLACIAELINSRFDGTITRHDLYELWLARTTTDQS